MLLSEMMIGRPLEIFVTREGYHYRVVSKIEHVSGMCMCDPDREQNASV